MKEINDRLKQLDGFKKRVEKLPSTGTSIVFKLLIEIMLEMVENELELEKRIEKLEMMSK